MSTVEVNNVPPAQEEQRFIEEEMAYEINFSPSTTSSSDNQSDSSQQSNQLLVMKRLPLKRARAEMSQHRLPYIGQMQVIEQYECYFKVEISMPFK